MRKLREIDNKVAVRTHASAVLNDQETFCHFPRKNYMVFGKVSLSWWKVKVNFAPGCLFSCHPVHPTLARNLKEPFPYFEGWFTLARRPRPRSREYLKDRLRSRCVFRKGFYRDEETSVVNWSEAANVVREESIGYDDTSKRKLSTDREEISREWIVSRCWQKSPA